MDGLILSDAAAVADPDGDGLLTWEEYFVGSDPLDATSRLALTDCLMLETNRVVLR